ncbi:MAG TPA: hypothetical protein VEA61_07625 [Allosphingosinicella sp.]|nr:hypothetical protein [Allosphingosinicella sp.]
MKMLKIVAAASMCLLLTGCFLSAGKFQSSLDLRRGGTFTYRYDGEVLLLTPHTMMSMMSAMDAPFDPEDQVCFDGEGDAEMRSLAKRQAALAWGTADLQDELEGEAARDCTPKELEERRKAFEKKRAEDKAMMEAVRGMFGGVDPRDPETIAEFIRRVQTYQGWKKVVHKGEGVFDVQYEVSGRIDRDFVFPVFPDLDMMMPFVQANRRADGSVRVAAPGFFLNEQMLSPSSMGAVMAAASASAGQAAGAPIPNFPKPEGMFTLTTDGEILTNNTEDGPSSGPAGTKTLKWVVGPLAKKKPEALIRL